jgi:amino-acid N-acetyltransferase
MTTQISIEKADRKHREAIIHLLKSEKLPVEDLAGQLEHFFIAKDNGLVVGAIGLEIYENNGLLRSLVVKKEYRKMKIGSGLINELENFGRKSGLNNFYLLTETAENYFKEKEYEVITRIAAPESIKQSMEYSQVCPSTAVLMKKTL